MVVGAAGLVGVWFRRAADPFRSAFDWCLLILVMVVVGFIATRCRLSFRCRPLFE